MPWRPPLIAGPVVGPGELATPLCQTARVGLGKPLFYAQRFLQRLLLLRIIAAIVIDLAQRLQAPPVLLASLALRIDNQDHRLEDRLLGWPQPALFPLRLGQVHQDGSALG